MMRERRKAPVLLALLVCGCLSLAAQQTPATSMDRDLMEITVSRLESLYASHMYTVRQVTQWYLDRIARYNDVYKPILHVDSASALAIAAAEDEAAARGGASFARGALWGVPVVIKSNTSVKGL